MGRKPLYEMDKDELFKFTRRLMVMVRRIGSLIDIPEEKTERASGNALCGICGLELFDHPEVNGSTDRVSCDGMRYHL